MLCIGKAALFFIFFFFSFRVAEIGYCFSNRLSMMPTSNSQQVPADLPALPKGATTPFALLTALLSHKLRYRAHERDMVVLTHEVIAAPREPEPEPDPEPRSESERERERGGLHEYARHLRQRHRLGHVPYRRAPDCVCGAARARWRCARSGRSCAGGQGGVSWCVTGS